jgi:hypothetical protein
MVIICEDITTGARRVSGAGEQPRMEGVCGILLVMAVRAGGRRAQGGGDVR